MNPAHRSSWTFKQRTTVPYSLHTPIRSTSLPPRTKMDFQYSPLHLGRPAFRLVKLRAGSGRQAINCDLIDAFFDDATTLLDYEAVSYTWGDATNTHNIALNERVFSIGDNLWSVLHDVRYPKEDRILWIDAISIDQDCHGERGHQVQQMDQIYRHASRVIIWLGTSTAITDLCMRSMREFQQFMPETKLTPSCQNWQERQEMRALSETWRSFGPVGYKPTFETILGRPWFRRVWIIQEVANARAAIIYCGQSYVLARTFVLCAFLSGVKPPQHCQAVLDIMPGPNRRTSWWSQKPDFYTILSRFWDAEATRGHDRIYGLLGLCPPAAEKVLVDYTKPINSVIRDAISFICGFDTRQLELEGFDTAMDFATNIEKLHQTVLVAMMRASHIHLAEHFLQENKAHCRMTPKLLKAVALFEVNEKESNHKRHNHLLHERWESDHPVIGPAERHKIFNCPIDLSPIETSDHWSAGRTQGILGQQDMLVDAAGAGAETTVKMLLGIGTEPNWRNGGSETPLHAAAGIGHLAIVQMLLDSGARCDARDFEGQTPFEKATASQHFEVAQLLLERGASYRVKRANYNL